MGWWSTRALVPFFVLTLAGAQFDQADLAVTVRGALSARLGDFWALLDFLGEATETGMVEIDEDTCRPRTEDIRKLLNSATHATRSNKEVLWFSYYVDIPGASFGYAMPNVSGVTNEYTFYGYPPSRETCVSFGLDGGCMVDQFVDQISGEPVPGDMLYGGQRVFGAEPCANASEYATTNDRVNGSAYNETDSYWYGDHPDCVTLPADVTTWISPPYSEPWDPFTEYFHHDLETGALRWWSNEPYEYCFVVDNEYRPCTILSSHRAVSLPGVGICSIFEASWDIASIHSIVGRAVAGDSTALVFVLEGTTSRIIAVSDFDVTFWDAATGDAFKVEQVESAAIQAAWTFMSDTARADADDEGVSHIVNDTYWLRWVWLEDDYGLMWRVSVVQTIECPVGYGVDRIATGSCFACSAGTFSNEVMLDCINCPSGTVAPIAGSEACVPCRSGWYQNDGATQCERCVEPYTSVERATRCSLCMDGWYSPRSDNISCAPCPQHATCVNQMISTDAGYYRSGPASFVFHECFQGQACLGGNATPSLCGTGYSGVLCAVCEPGFVFSFGHCLDCDLLSYNTATVAVSVIVALVLVVNGLKRSKRFSATMESVSFSAEFKVIFATLQILGVYATTLSDVLVQPLKGFLERLTSLTGVRHLFGGLGVSCAHHKLGLFKAQLLIATGLPIVLSGCVAAACAFRVVVLKVSLAMAYSMGICHLVH